MYAIRARRKVGPICVPLSVSHSRSQVATEKDFLDAVNKVYSLSFVLSVSLSPSLSVCLSVSLSSFSHSHSIFPCFSRRVTSQVIKGFAKFSSTPRYMTYN